MLGFDTVREIGLTLPDVIETAAYGARALKLNGKLLARVPVNESVEANCAADSADDAGHGANQSGTGRLRKSSTWIPSPPMSSVRFTLNAAENAAVPACACGARPLGLRTPR